MFGLSLQLRCEERFHNIRKLWLRSNTSYLKVIFAQHNIRAPEKSTSMGYEAQLLYRHAFSQSPTALLEVTLPTN
jgi:hypothetical protein